MFYDAVFVLNTTKSQINYKEVMSLNERQTTGF